MVADELTTLAGIVRYLEANNVGVDVSDMAGTSPVTGNCTVTLELVLDGAESIQISADGDDSTVPTISNTPVAGSRRFECDHCDDVFDDPSGLGVHLADEHGAGETEIRSVPADVVRTDVVVGSSPGDHASVEPSVDDGSESVDADASPWPGDPSSIGASSAGTEYVDEEDDSSADQDTTEQFVEQHSPDEDEEDRDLSGEMYGDRAFGGYGSSVAPEALEALGVGKGDKLEVLDGNACLELHAGPDPDLQEREEHVGTYSVNTNRAGTLMCQLTENACRPLNAEDGDRISFYGADQHVLAVVSDAVDEDGDIVDEDAEDDDQDEFECDYCDETFDKKQSRTWHERAAHVAGNEDDALNRVTVGSGLRLGVQSLYQAGIDESSRFGIEVDNDQDEIRVYESTDRGQYEAKLAPSTNARAKADTDLGQQPVRQIGWKPNKEVGVFDLDEPGGVFVIRPRGKESGVWSRDVAATGGNS